MTPGDVLEACADLLECTGFTAGACARDGEGRVVRTDDPSAICFCVSGAARVILEYPDDTSGGAEALYLAAMDAFAGHVGVARVKEWADAEPRTTESVVAAVRSAARRCVRVERMLSTGRDVGPERK